MRNSIVLIAAMCWAAQAAAAVPSNAREQWDILDFDLQNRTAFAQRASQTFQPESLIQASDRDPLNVLLRRTAALLDDLKSRTDLSVCGRELDALHATAQKVAATDSKRAGNCSTGCWSCGDGSRLRIRS